MGVNEMLGQFVHYRKTLYDHGFLDKQFTQLQQLQDESSPRFVMEVVTCYFKDSERILNELDTALIQQNVDFKRIDAHVHQLKGSSASLGAPKVMNACIALRGLCETQDAQLCQTGLQQAKQEFLIFKEYLEKLLEMEKQIVAAGGSIPPMLG